MDFLTIQWLPIVVGTFVLWQCSFLAWAVLSHHFGDHRKLHCESELLDLVKSKDVATGNYLFPYTDTNGEQNSANHQERYRQGPRGMLCVYDLPSMPINMLKTVVYFLVTVGTIAYITHVACPPDAASTDFMRVFRVSGTIGILTYASSGVLNRIWFRRRMWTDIVDGIGYGLVLGLVFSLLWKYPVA